MVLRSRPSSRTFHPRENQGVAAVPTTPRPSLPWRRSCKARALRRQCTSRPRARQRRRTTRRPLGAQRNPPRARPHERPDDDSLLRLTHARRWFHMRPVTTYHAKTVHPPASRSGAHQVGGRHDPIRRGLRRGRGNRGGVAARSLGDRGALHLRRHLVPPRSLRAAVRLALVDRAAVGVRAFGHPYLELPPLGGLVTLGILSSLGAVAGAVIATRTPKTA
jgi:hypothetical protein